MRFHITIKGNKLTMKKVLLSVTLLIVQTLLIKLMAQDNKAHNPIIFADVPDMSMVRVGDTYYMSSTTMHMSPGVPIMSSKDLVNWKVISYAYDTLVSNDEMNLNNGKSTYGRGSWASSMILWLVMMK
jgi:beta-xylosidase